MKTLLYLEESPVRGGIEIFAERQLNEMEAAGLDAELASAIPDDFSPYGELIVHKCTRVSDLERFPPEKTVLYVHDHEMICPRGTAYTALMHNCSLRGGSLACFFCAPLCRGWRKALSRVLSQKRRLEAMARMKKLVVISDFMKSRLEANGIPGSKISVEPPKLRLKEPGEAAIPEVDILYAGQLIRGKGVQLLLKAFAKLKPDRTLDIIGTGNFEGRLKNLASGLGIASRVRWRGFQENPQDWMRKAKCVAVPSFWQEPYGLVAAEAVSLGVKVVAFAVGGLPEACGGRAKLVAPGDVDAFARALEED